VTEVFSILTIPPNELARKLHNNPKSPNGSRMLLLLTADRIPGYLNPEASKEDLQKLFQPMPAEQMDAYPTPRFLKKEFADRLNTPFVRERIDYPELFFA
jgi:putative SOS response-associated peptidase YedK